MKFLRITFRCFGPFENQTLDLSDASGFHVVLGPNEAGKSSALRGLNALLFGFPVQSNDDFRFKYSQFRILALLENSAGKTLPCVRRKGIKATLVTRDEKTEIPDAIWTEFLGGLQLQQFEQLFGLDSQRLVEGGRQIVEGQGDLGEALFAAGAGLAGLRTLVTSLEERKLALYKFRGQTQPINKALTGYAKHLTDIRNNLLPPEVYAAAANATHMVQEKADTLRGERTEVRSQLSLLHRYRIALPTIELYQRARKQLDLVADAPILPPNFDAKVSAAREKREIARGKMNDLAVRHKELERQLRDAQPPALVLAEESEIDELKMLIGVDAKQQSEAIKADTRRSELEGKARDIFRELTGTTAWEQMGGLRLRLDDQQRITELANQHTAVLEDVANCENEVRVAREQLAVAKARQADTPKTVDPTPWLALADSIAAHGPIEQHTQNRQMEITEAESRLANEFERFQPAVPIVWSEAASIPVPSAETVTKFRREFELAHQVLMKAKAVREQIDRDIAVLNDQLADVVGSDTVPTTNDLLEARQRRDDGIKLIRRRLAADPDLVEEEHFANIHAPGRSLIDAAEVTIRTSDELADRLRREADRVAAWQSRHQKLENLQKRRLEVADESAAAEAGVARISPAWQSVWQPSGVAPEAPEVMQPWLIGWHRFVEQVEALRGLRLKCQTDEQQIANQRAQLTKGCPATQTTKTLAEGLALARQVSANSRKQLDTAERLNEEVLRLQAAVNTAASESSRANARRTKWMEQWSEAISVLKIGASSITVATAQDYLRQIGDMQQHLTDMRIRVARVKEIAEERTLLLERITALRRRLSSDARTSTAESLDSDFREVDTALAEARNRRAKYEELTFAFNKTSDELAATTDSLREAEAAVTVLAAQAGVANGEEIASAVQRSTERVLAAQRFQEQESALAENSIGQSLEVFLAAALENREHLDRDIDDLEMRAKELDPAISTAEAEYLKAQQILEGYQQASDAAAEAKQQSELVASRLEDQVIEYAALSLAQVVLDRAKERYRARNQDSLLSRAGEFFKTLTDQAFEGLDIDNEEGADVLRAVRAPGHPCPRVPVAGLSEGTRDQLFLALRLAGIEQHLQNREPVPLIIDDILVSFDDARARSTLKCLGELAQKTQVLLFTHHRHIVDLAVASHEHTVVHEMLPISTL